MYASNSIQKRHRVIIALCIKQFARNNVAVDTDGFSLQEFGFGCLRTRPETEKRKKLDKRISYRPKSSKLNDQILLPGTK
jgi:hypothetical protein